MHHPPRRSWAIAITCWRQVMHPGVNFFQKRFVSDKFQTLAQRREHSTLPKSRTSSIKYLFCGGNRGTCQARAADVTEASSDSTSATNGNRSQSCHVTVQVSIGLRLKTEKASACEPNWSGDRRLFSVPCPAPSWLLTDLTCNLHEAFFPTLGSYPTLKRNQSF